MAYVVPRCPACHEPALRDKRDAEAAALTFAALPGRTLACVGCGHAFSVNGSVEWVEIPED